MFLPFPRKTKTREKPVRHQEKQHSVKGLLCYGYLCLLGAKQVYMTTKGEPAHCCEESKGKCQQTTAGKHQWTYWDTSQTITDICHHGQRLQEQDGWVSGAGPVYWTGAESLCGGNICPLHRKLAQIGWVSRPGWVPASLTLTLRLKTRTASFYFYILMTTLGLTDTCWIELKWN